MSYLYTIFDAEYLSSAQFEGFGVLPPASFGYQALLSPAMALRIFCWALLALGAMSSEAGFEAGSLLEESFLCLVDWDGFGFLDL